MAGPGQLCEVVAGLLGKSLPTVVAYDYQLAQAGLRTTGGRGRSAAKMTAHDAAALLIVSMANPAIKDTIATFTSYSMLWAKSGTLTINQNYRPVDEEKLGSAWDLRFLPPNSVTQLGSNHTFLQFVAALIESATGLRLGEGSEPENGLLVPSLNITMTAPWIGARVAIETINIGEKRTYNVKGTKAGYVGPPSVDLLSSYTISDQTIYAVSKCLRDEPLASRVSRAKSATEPLEELPTEPLRKLRTEPRPKLSARQMRLMKKFQDRHASDPTARAKRKEQQLKAKSEPKDQLPATNPDSSK